MLAVQADAHDIVTAEGVALLEGENWENIESTLVQSGAFQCGFCTSGMVVSLEEILANKALVTRSDILSRLSGQVCRCTGYEPILLAFETLLDAAHLLRKEQL
jgi:carbon-monoxide dehydrogenase small subunit